MHGTASRATLSATRKANNIKDNRSLKSVLSKVYYTLASEACYLFNHITRFFVYLLTLPITQIYHTQITSRA